jgi:quinol monooxygenase YgiN
MSIVFTSRFFPKDWAKMKVALAKYTAMAKENGCTMSRVYQRDGDPKEALWISEWPSHEAVHKYGDLMGEEFNSLLTNPDTDDAAWDPTDAPSI